MLNKRDSAWLIFIIIAIASICFAGYLEVFLEYVSYDKTGVLSGFAALQPHALHFIRLGMMCLGAVVLGSVLWKFHATVLHVGYQYRYGIALVVLLVCVLFEISGSSIAYLGKYLGTDDTGVLFGIPRGIRSDEYATFTPFVFSQYYNYTGQYAYFSETIRGALTDTSIIYGLPAWDIATIFRPFLWGYLLLGSAKGLAFFGIARLLALFFVSFEFAMVYTKRDKWLSLAAAVLIALAPIVQWWFAINGLVEMLIFGQAALMCVYHFMRTTKTSGRLLASMLFFWCGGGYLLTFYPAWQVPLFYVFIALLVYIILDNRKGFVFRWKKDLPIIMVGFLLLVVGVAHILIKSSETISMIMNTAYPGERAETGGGGFTSLFKYGSSLFFPLNSDNLNTNTCEASAFFDFFPLGMLLSLYVIFFERKKDRMLIPLLAAECILLTYCLLGFPEPSAKASLLSLAPTNRVLLAVGLINILLLIRSLTLSEYRFKLGAALAIALALSVAVGLLCRSATGSYLGKYCDIVLVAVLFVGFLLILSIKRQGGKKLFVLFCALVAVLSGGLVNPIQQGIDVIYKSELVETIQNITEQDHGLWIVEGAYPLTNIPIMAGAPTINSTNVYPDLERWAILDPDGQYEDIYNRYAHITVDLSDKKTRFDLVYTDSFLLTLNYKDLETLDVRYVLTTEDCDIIDNPYVKFNLLHEVNGYYIYEITYPE